MAKIKTNVSANDVDGTVVKVYGRYKLKSSSTWLNYTHTLPTPQASGIITLYTPEITTQGVYDHELRVEDNDGAFSHSGNTWGVAPDFQIGNCTPNTGPTANAGIDQTKQLISGNTNPIVFNLDGSGSSDPDGPITYSWVVTAGVLSNPNVPKPTWTLPASMSNETATLTVTDTSNATDSDSMIATITPAATYGNTQQSQSFTRNNCGNGFTGSAVTYIVPPNTFYAASVSDANNIALADIAANGQDNANDPTKGTCTAINTPPEITGITYPDGNCAELPTPKKGLIQVTNCADVTGVYKKTTHSGITGDQINDVHIDNETGLPFAGGNNKYRLCIDNTGTMPNGNHDWNASLSTDPGFDSVGNVLLTIDNNGIITATETC